MPLRESNYTTLLMSTGLTFGRIPRPFTVLPVVLSAKTKTHRLKPLWSSVPKVVSTFIAQTWFETETVVAYEPVFTGSLDHFLHMPEEDF